MCFYKWIKNIHPFFILLVYNYKQIWQAGLIREQIIKKGSNPTETKDLSISTVWSRKISKFHQRQSAREMITIIFFGRCWEVFTRVGKATFCWDMRADSNFSKTNIVKLIVKCNECFSPKHLHSLLEEDA